MYLFFHYNFCSSFPRIRHKRGRLTLGQWQFCRDRQKYSAYPRYRDNEVRLFECHVPVKNNQAPHYINE